MDTFQEFEELINNINDKVFKATFQNKEAAVEYLERFVTQLATMLDLENMTLSDTNFVSEGLEEYFCDVVYETHIKLKRKSKNLVRVILLFEHKKGIKSYFDLFLQLLGYIVAVWKQDRSEDRQPTIVIPLVINQGKQTLKAKTLHDTFKNIPTELLKYIPQFQFHLLNIQPLENDVLLSLKDDGILRSLFLAYVAVEDKERIENILIEMFKFISKRTNFEQYFQQLFAFLAQEGEFSGTEMKEMLNTYLSQEKQKKMATTAQVWERRGERRGEKLGKKNQARLMVLRGHFRKQEAALLADLAFLPLKEVNILIAGFDAVKMAWLIDKVDLKDLMKKTTLSEEEILFIIECLNSEKN
jgi:Putative transposase, YhgA-like